MQLIHCSLVYLSDSTRLLCFRPITGVCVDNGLHSKLSVRPHCFSPSPADHPDLRWFSHHDVAGPQSAPPQELFFCVSAPLPPPPCEAHITNCAPSLPVLPNVVLQHLDPTSKRLASTGGFSRGNARGEPPAAPFSDGRSGVRTFGNVDKLVTWYW